MSMIQNTIKENEYVTPVSREMDGLHEYFPQCFDKEGHFDIEKFREAIEPQVDVVREGRSYDFLGKSYARMLSSLDTTTVIRPDVEHNSKPENVNSENIYISGDNLDALHHLVKSYTGQVKCIYIDPPYNTGTDGFVYNDKFKFTAKDLEKKLSIGADEAEKIIAMTSGHRASHAAWLTFMMPRLQLARELLSKDGVIFISIDDNEQAYLKQLCDNVYGEDCFVATVHWWKNYASANDANKFSNVIDYILVYSKNEEFKRNLLPRTDKQNALYKYDSNDGKGLWRSDNLSVRTYSANYDYPIVNPNTGVSYNPPRGRSWMTNRETIEIWIKENRVFFGQDGMGAPQLKRYLNEVQAGVVPTTFWSYEDCGHNDEARKELKDLFEIPPFDSPKPTRLIKQVLTIGSGPDDIVVDFFSGSATTAEAVMRLNAERGMHRKYIMVQWKEECAENSQAYKAGYRTIDQIGMERIKRAAKKIKEENTLFAGDLGFKHYTLEEVPQNTLDKLETFDPNVFLTTDDTLNLFGRETVLTTWLMQDGYGLNAKTQDVKLDNYHATLCGNHLYMTDSGFTEDDMVALIDLYQKEPSFCPDCIVLFGYSFSHNTKDMLEKNKPTVDLIKDIKLIIDVRY